jgi:hypothetical protein
MKTNVKSKNVDVKTHNTVFADIIILSVLKNSEPNFQKTRALQVYGRKKTQLAHRVTLTAFQPSIQPGTKLSNLKSLSLEEHLAVYASAPISAEPLTVAGPNTWSTEKLKKKDQLRLPHPFAN